MLKGRCIIFTFSEVSTFLTIATLGQVRDPFNLNVMPSNIEVFYFSEDKKSLLFSSRRKRSGPPEVTIFANGSYSEKVAFNTAFKVRDTDSLCKILYQVRCNLFHGNKIYGRDTDDEVVRFAGHALYLVLSVMLNNNHR